MIYICVKLHLSKDLKESCRIFGGKCCPNYGMRYGHRLWEAESVLGKEFVTCFLILPDEFIDNQIDNVAITKNCQKGPRAARDPLQFCVNALKHLLGVAQPGLET